MQRDKADQRQKIRCPKCRSGHLSIYEPVKDPHYISVYSGRGYARQFDHWSENLCWRGECWTCRHKWRVRENTAKLAIEQARAAQEARDQDRAVARKEREERKREKAARREAREARS